MKFVWDHANDFRAVYVDGALSDSDNNTFTLPALASDSMYIGAYGGLGNAQGAISNFEITNDPLTPDNWSVFGNPLHIPYFDKDDVTKRMGDDYVLDWTPQGHLMFRDKGLVNGDQL